MRELSLEYLKNAADAKERPKVERVFEVNGGRPVMGDIGWNERGEGNKKTVTFFGEPGLSVPGVLVTNTATIRGVRIYVSDDGKSAEIGLTPPATGYVSFYFDLLGIGELSGIELRYPVYLGRSVAYIGGASIARAASALRSRSANVEVIARGPLATLAATFAGLLDPALKIKGTDALREWSEYLSDGVPDAAVQPRANLLPTLEELRKKVGGTWEYRPGT
jgi:hypothetical protein